MKAIYPPTPGHVQINYRRPVLTRDEFGTWTMSPPPSTEPGTPDPGGPFGARFDEAERWQLTGASH